MATVFGSSVADTISPSGNSAGVIGAAPGNVADVINGYDGNDLLDGGGGANTILGGAGNDTVFASGSGESLDGGDGIDTYAYAGAAWSLIDLGFGFVSRDSVTGTVLGFEQAYAGSGRDTLKGGDGNDTLGGGAGNDIIEGRAGFDVVDYGTSFGGAPVMAAIVNLSASSVTLGGTAYAAGTARDGWGGLDTLHGSDGVVIEGAIGTAFADTLIGRTDAASRLEGGAGDDSLVGGNGANTILGGAGDDTVAANGYSESLAGGEGDDALVFQGSKALVINLGTEVTSDGLKGFVSDNGLITTIISFDRAYAGAGNDTLKGSSGNDTLAGGAGSNLIDGQGGFDTVDYGTSPGSAITAGVLVNLSAGGVTLSGTNLAANTALNPWAGTDRFGALNPTSAQPISNIQGVIGTAFSDTMLGSNLDNRLEGGAGADSLNGSGGNDTLLGGAGDDTLRGGDGSDSIDAGSGNDSLLGGLGSDSVEGGGLAERNSIDYRFGTSGYAGGALTLGFTDAATATVGKAGGGSDTLHDVNQVFATGNADRLDFSGAGKTVSLPFLVRGGAGSDTITGNGTEHVVADYNDVVNGSSVLAVNVNLATGVANDGQGGIDSLVNIHAVLATYGGNDTLAGSGGDDTFIISGLGAKTITGGGGHDTYRYQGGSGVLIDLGTATVAGGYLGSSLHSGATDTITGFDRAYGGLGADTVKGTNGSDTLGGDVGADILDGRAGSDVVDYSAFSLTPIGAGVLVNLSTGSQTIGGTTLAAGTAKDAWGAIDTLANFEGAIGTDFADTLFGTNLADTFTGNGGDDSISSGGSRDTLLGGDGNDSLKGGDDNDLLDGGAGWDVAVYSTVASTAAGWARNPATGVWTVTSAEGTDSLTNIEALSFSDRRVDFAKAIPNDVNGDGASDILWRNADGGLAYWTMHGLAGTGTSLPTVSSDWTLLGTGDLNGDGWADLLWRHAGGALTTWYSGGTGFVGGGGTIATVDAAWKVAAIGDMNRDGRADILWRHADGSVALWTMDGTSVTGGGGIGTVDNSWSIVGLADFNADNRDDIVWRNADGTVAVWLMDGTTLIGGGTVYNPGAAWKVAGMGDFDGDGKADLLWRNDDGSVSAWTMNGNAVTATGGLGNPGTGWTVAKVADYNGDGKSDILWHDAGGSVALWLMNGFSVASTGTLGNAGTWMIA